MAAESLEKKFQVTRYHLLRVAVDYFYTVNYCTSRLAHYTMPQTHLIPSFKSPLCRHSILQIPPSYPKSLPTISSPASGPTLYLGTPEAIDVTQSLGFVEHRIADNTITSRASRASGLHWSAMSMVATGGVMEGGLDALKAEGL